MRPSDTESIVSQYLKGICPVRYTVVTTAKNSPSKNPQSLLVRLAISHPQLAADTILHPDVRGKLKRVVGYAIRKLDRAFEKMSKEERGNAYETLIELALNLVGMEGERIGFLPGERSGAFSKIVTTLLEWEKQERSAEGSQGPVAEEVVNRLLENMKRVLSGKSMLARIALTIEKELHRDEIAVSFVLLAAEEIQSNVYYRMRSQNMSKFGNDSATGLRFLRHLGFVQVSSNPVIAARAYEEFPDLWERLKEVVEANPGWLGDPDRCDELTIHATLVSLLPNVLVFRPLALLSGFRDGMVSYQLNPFHATSVKESVLAAEYICFFLREILRQYDAWLGWGSRGSGGRPNIVFKVAACGAIAREITKKLNRRGIGTNNTVTYSVSQELQLLIDAARGMAGALTHGVPISQIYETNMIGRMEDHLREREAERLIAPLDQDEAADFATALGAKIERNSADTVKVLASKKYLKSLTDERLVEALVRHGYNETHTRVALAELEEDIEHAGIFVTRRVWQFFFAPDAREKWMRYFEKKFGLTADQARAIMDRIDLLPASKRRNGDTYLVLGTPNVTNTEFPDQQLKVFSQSFESDFDLSRYQESIGNEPDPEVLRRLLEIEDFRKAYEFTPSLEALLKKVGISYGEDGGRGLRPQDWSSFGAVRKTMSEFKTAYTAFRKKVFDTLRMPPSSPLD